MAKPVYTSASMTSVMGLLTFYFGSLGDQDQSTCREKINAKNLIKSLCFHHLVTLFICDTKQSRKCFAISVHQKQKNNYCCHTSMLPNMFNLIKIHHVRRFLISASKSTKFTKFKVICYKYTRLKSKCFIIIWTTITSL